MHENQAQTPTALEVIKACIANAAKTLDITALGDTHHQYIDAHGNRWQGEAIDATATPESTEGREGRRLVRVAECPADDGRIGVTCS